MALVSRYRAIWFWLACSMLASLLGARVAAQTCHTPDDPREVVVKGASARAERLAYPFRVVAGALFAGYDRAGEQGDYEGLYAGFAYRQPWFGAELLLPAYRLARDEDTELGIGDLMVTARGTALRAYEGEITLGLELPAMLPTGRESAGLGMGHVMLMPALWFALAREPLSLRAQAGYGRVLGPAPADHAAHHAHGQAPLVNPMNRSEFEHALVLGLGVQRHVTVHARWFGAIPIADEVGVTRQILGAGATLGFDQADLTLELQRPVAGNPFEFKVILQLAARF